MADKLIGRLRYIRVDGSLSVAKLKEGERWHPVCQEAADKMADLTAERDALREALGDSQATLCAVRATSVSDDWAEASTAKHLHDICGDTMQRNAAALKGDPANG